MSNEGYIARFEELFRSFDNLSQEINKQREQNQRDNAEHRQRRAEAARRGELGEDWKACLELLGDAGVPVAGWVKAAFDIAKDAWKFIQMVMSIYDIINMVFDIMESLVEAKDKLIEVRFTIANLAEAAVRGAAARV